MRGWVTENQALGALERLRLGQRSGQVQHRVLRNLVILVIVLMIMRMVMVIL